ncbi:MAG: thioredoxin domain-containing protein [Candidatus Doudnabacteria bacterium]|nr:thioredoxin domain-containing protein [Candidatus Doudnabacteria bacterium]
MAKSTKPQTEETVITLDIKPLLQPVATIIASIIIAAAIMLSGGTVKTGTTTAGTTSSAAANPPAAVTTGSTSIDDDPILGNRDTAKVAIVEFSDYECPFCQRFWEQTLPQIKSTYIDSGEVVLVYRDLPLTSIHPNAQRYANAVNCALDQGGNTAYFNMHDAVFAAVNNGELSNSKLGDLAAGIGLNKTDLESCITSNKYDAEINADSSAGAAAGINGTPGFIVGTLNADGTVSGDIISGAQPFSAFEAAISKYL